MNQKNDYQHIEPYNVFHLDVWDGHHLWIQESGNPEWIPVFYIHGWPWWKSKDWHRRLFDPSKYRIIQVDQRWCGKSKYDKLLQANTTDDLVEDIEKVRKHLDIEKMLLVGSSRWPALIVRYTVKYTQNCIRLVCISPFLCLEESLDVYKFGNILSQFYPDVEEDFKKILKWRELYLTLAEIIENNYESLTADDRNLIVAWSNREYTSIKYMREYPEPVGIDDISSVFYKNFQLLVHYFANDCFNPLQIKELLLSWLQDISIDFIQWRYDMCSPVRGIRNFTKQLPKAVLHIVEDSAHRTWEVWTTNKVIELLDKIKV